MSQKIKPSTGWVGGNTSKPTAPVRPSQPIAVGTIATADAGKITKQTIAKGKP